MATAVSLSPVVSSSSQPCDQQHGIEYARERFDDSQRAGREGLKVAATFCPENEQTPFDTVSWELRSAAIKDESGKVLFEQTDCEVPASWTQLAANVVVSKYFYGDPRNPGERERSVRQLIHRVTRTIADWGLADGYFDSPEDGERFYRDLTWLCLHQHGSFNSPVWFNVGLHQQYGISGTKCNWHWDRQSDQVDQPENPYEYPQASACFIQQVGDNMEDIMRLACSEAMLFKFGSGTGTDLSTIRSQREKLSGGGTPSGPLSFMKVYDSIAGVIKSGGKTRRAAKMQSLKVWHPDILEFIQCKWSEEKKAHALIREGYESNFNGEAYSSVCFQNANLSVRVTDDFMQAVREGGRWQTRWVSDKATGTPPQYDARELLGQMAECAWHCGDPGVQYDTTINKWHTCPNDGRINASNPCVTGDTLVSTAEGYRRIIDLVGKEVILVDQNNVRRVVSQVFKTGTKPVYKLTTRSGYQLRLTADHKVWTANRGDVPACELTKDDRVVLNPVGFGCDELDVETAEVVGLMLGDGCISRSSVDGEPISTLVMDRDWESSVVADVRQRINHLKAASEDGRTRRQVNISAGASVMTARVATGSRVVAELLERFAVLDMGSVGKKLTDAAFGLQRTAVAGLLRGLFTADGCVYNYGVKSQAVSLDSVSLEMLRQVQLLLLGFGIKSKLYLNRRVGELQTLMPDGKGGTKQYNVQQMHSLRISRSSRVRFEKEIGFWPGSRKQQQLELLNQTVATYADRMDDPVASLVADGIEDVYDLTEPATSHFGANGLVVHNCSEYMFLDDTACNLASINLLKFVRTDGTFDHQRYQQACRLFLIAQEILVDHASYPTSTIAENSHRFRPLGLGYSNLGSVIMTAGLPYDSDAARSLCGSITAIMHASANYASAEMAAVVGPFAGYAANEAPMLHVMQMHREAVEQISDAGPPELKDAARKLWDGVLEIGKKHGFRNAQATVLAPTGTISFMMDCDTTGIEPDIALVKYKQLAGGGMLKMVNQTVAAGLRKLGYSQPQIEAIIAYIDQNDTIEGAPELADEHLPVFDCAFKPANGVRSIPWQAHVMMMAAAQPFLSGAISKTVNMPSDVTAKDIADAYFWGWELGLKAIAIYRDGSKQSQPLNTKSKDSKEQAGAATVEIRTVEKIVYKPRRERLEDTRQSITHKFSIAGHEGYLCVGLYPDGRPGEIFITMAKEGSTIGGIMDSFGTALSIALQYGVPLEVLVNKFSHTRFEPMGYTTNKDIRIAKSVVDYIARWLGLTFLSAHPEFGKPGRTAGPSDEPHANAPIVEQAVALVQGAVQNAAIRKPENANGETSLSNGNGHSHGTSSSGRAQLSGPMDQFARFQSDAPSCDNCGSITVRNGNCYLCHNCGNSMGCS